MNEIDNKTLLNILKSSTILYIEDEIKIQEQMTKTLKYFSENIICVTNYSDALKEFVVSKPSIVISDIRLGEKSGIDIVKEIRKIDKITPIILLTAFTDNEYLFDAVKLKLVNYLVKPVDFTQLSNSLKDAAKEIIEKGNYQIKLASGVLYDVFRNILVDKGEEINLTVKETELLKIFLKNKNRRTSMEEIKKTVWQDEFTSDGAVKALLSKVRSKIGKDSIDNLSGVGYILITS